VQQRASSSPTRAPCCSLSCLEKPHVLRSRTQLSLTHPSRSPSLRGHVYQGRLAELTSTMFLPLLTFTHQTTTISSFVILLYLCCAPPHGHPDADRSCRRAHATLRRAPPPATVAKPPLSTMGQATGAYGFVQSRGASPALSPVSFVVVAPLNLATALPSRHRSWPGHRGQAPAMLSPSMDACEPPNAPPHLLHR
jgi:hypothetical protein